MGNKKKALLISCFGWTDNRLVPISKIISSKYKCSTIVCDFDHIKKQYVEKDSRFHYVHVPPYKKNVSVSRILSHSIFSLKIKRIIDIVKPDLIYCLVPPNSVGYFCGKYKKRHPNVKLVVDAIDLWPESFPAKKLHNTLPFLWWKSLRSYGLFYADKIFIECDLYKDTLSKYVSNHRKISLLRIFKPQTEEERKLVLKMISKRQKRRELDPNTIKLAYLGSINHIVDIEGICDVVSALTKTGKNVIVSIIGDGESRSLFIDKLQKMGCIVNYHGKVFDEKSKIKILGDCDYGINMMISSISVGLTTKSLDYFSLGLPIINNIKGDTSKIVSDEGIGINVVKGNRLILREIEPAKVLSLFDSTFSQTAFSRNAKLELQNASII